MGSRFEITTTAISQTTADQAVQKAIEEISRIEQVLSEWSDTTQTGRINALAGIRPVKADSELIQLINRCRKISELTGGAFDISFASMDKIWKFDRTERPLPDSAIVREARKLIDYRKIAINTEASTVYLPEKGMRIGFGAIGKGYAANRAMLVLKKIPGVKGGVINASGDIMVWGDNQKPGGWSIQIAHPEKPGQSIGSLRINNMSVVTSGDYEKYFTSNDIRYSHIINPTTGYPVTEIKSATIISPDAELSDALATSVCVLGLTEGLDLINRLKDVECLIIDHNNIIHKSNNLKLNENDGQTL
jgi:thiamine biosynthesis lipoprotein